ncbi:bifunctional 4-hydroxy-2-oxoglutarate aldolase/2-dehydro-3-deoxy-phosphogluconate aldolase [Parasphingopyxis sp. CP4]|uniref:bifunctional 4-hydroxy-2-oxoglutarate aldolase/2-dehydro-3-deoxy-phosphogluconate aldolase n=1 Tax=Parasphingopyxis sp. CP4 TaxID=2724527 RepID=UPI00159FAD83|nr:bifunctional 4-hydroxy-2-oxoglutarate aldolase/2-dehydro-3-deoxy-phosphogluconate aldolase [Parasphingopyxis sp. CP4]QLC20786.1 bifunctional 4-hydroxy-2-oxoglutarate aldolase/2-dehydro-3-deoxy-phosphogluconate aldolase [Parasphingopyxis sp. CP4]
MRTELDQRLAATPVIPLISGDDPMIAVETAKALQEGGLSVIEVVMRSDAAQDCMEAIIAETQDVIVGAGTVLTLDQAQSLHASGAAFIVCPGLVDEIARYCIDQDIPVYPGTMTAGEVQRAYALGLRDVKFFPASLAGGVPMLRALGSVFREMRFMPTGGISAENLSDYLALPHVLACGGSWLTPRAAVDSCEFGTIKKLAREAAAIAARSRGKEQDNG